VTDAVASGKAIMFAGRALGSRVGLTLVDVRHEDAQGIWDAVCREFDAVDQALSGFRADSEITALNRRVGRQPDAVNGRLYTGLALAQRAWRATDGRFDPRVHAALRRLEQPGLLAVDGPATTLGSPSPWLCRDPRRGTVALTEPIDLHGIGKGLALRWAWRLIEPMLPPSAGLLLDAGGDLVGRAPDATGGEWLIGIEDPAGGSDPVAVLALARGAVCTSSVRLGRWTGPDGNGYHHLIDPTAGAPADDGLIAVTVAGPDPAWCEIRTKDLFLRGRTAIARRARELGLAAWWVTDDGSVEMTPYARLVTRWP
jgi:thiamine biosynthesis lipoprotein